MRVIVCLAKDARLHQAVGAVGGFALRAYGLAKRLLFFLDWRQPLIILKVAACIYGCSLHLDLLIRSAVDDLVPFWLLAQVFLRRALRYPALNAADARSRLRHETILAMTRTVILAVLLPHNHAGATLGSL